MQVKYVEAYVFQNRNASDNGTNGTSDDNDALRQMYSELNATILGSYHNTSEILKHLVSDVKSLNNHVMFTDQNLDDFFFIINGILVLLMQVGFACLESGSIQSKNVTNIMLKNFLDSLICCLVFWLCGYALAFGVGNWFVGLCWWAAIGMPDQFWSHWFFQYTFASTASTILSGAVAERCTFVAYIFYSALMSGVIYPIAIHWAWTEQGWLYTLGFKDFGGGMLVHGLAGTACLVASILIGPRIGRFGEKKCGEDRDDCNPLTTGHSSALIGIGGIVILVGFCGFNTGTLNHYSLASDGETISRIVRNTIMCAAASSFTVLFAGKLGVFGDCFWPFSLTVNGGIAGLVASCGGCDIYSALESVIIGFVSGFVYIILRCIILYLEIDDPLDSSPIHMGCGIWSVMAVPLVGNGGILYNDITTQLQKLLVQAEGVFAVIFWSLITSTGLFGTLKLCKLLRATEQEELIGMDIMKHKQVSYSIDMNVSSHNAQSTYIMTALHTEPGTCMFFNEFLNGSDTSS